MPKEALVDKRQVDIDKSADELKSKLEKLTL